MALVTPCRRRITKITLIVTFLVLINLKFMSLSSDSDNAFAPDPHPHPPPQQKFFPICGCRGNATLRVDSSCSDESSQLTTGQKVISYSYFHWGSNYMGLERFQLAELIYSPSPYRMGILENLKAMRQLYPDFVMRLYTDYHLEGEFCELLCENPDLHWCDIRKTPSHGDLSSMDPPTWRFLVLGDPTVDIFLSRDLDSMLTERDQAAVSDWLDGTDKAIHIMRDSPLHGVPIPAGLWGASNSRLLKSFGSTSVAERRARIIKSSISADYLGFDQMILRNRLYNFYKNESVAHDSYSCRKWGDDLIRPFPVRRKNANNDFVGCPNLGEVEYELDMCPGECRPSYGKDWLYC